MFNLPVEPEREKSPEEPAEFERNKELLEDRPETSPAHLLSIINAASDALITLDQNQKIVIFNRAAEIMFGVRADEVLSQPLDRFIPEQFRGAHAHFIQLFGQTGVSKRQMQALTTLSALRSNGEEFPIEANISQVEINGQKFFTVIIREVTERIRVEQDLRDSEHRFKILSEATFEGVVIHHDGWIVEANTLAAEMFGYNQPDELVGRMIDRHLSAETLAVLQQRVVEGSEESYEGVAIRKDGSHFPVEARGKLTEYQGQTVRVKVLRDITERKRAEEALQRIQAQLLQSQKMEGVGRLAAGIAHDFNNLLTAIVGYSELGLLRIGENDPLYENLTEIQNAAERATSLTRQLLVFSRQQVLKPRPLNLNTVVVEMDKLLHRLIGEDVELLSFPDPNLKEVMADPGQIEQVIMNLAVNARDAMPGGGKLTIETANVELDHEYFSSTYTQMKSGIYVMLAVSDTGHGMDEATRQKIFEPFFTTKERGKGTGLGLATVYGIIEQSEGYIMVYSEVGIGTTFKIYLPQLENQPVSDQLAPAEAEPTPSTSEVLQRDLKINADRAPTILLVEDEDLVRELMQKVLSKAGYTIVEASNGKEALERLNEHPHQIDLIITDIIMPQMGGHELIKHLRTQHPDLKIVGMSGYTDQAIIRQGILEQFDAFLQKPFTPKTLLRQVKEILFGSA